MTAGGPGKLSTPTLACIAVGGVISGDFFGWQNTLEGGLGGALLSAWVAGLLFLLLSVCVAELTARLPRAAGPFGFAHAAFGPRAGFAAGLAELQKVVVVTAVINVGLSSYLASLLGVAGAQGSGLPATHAAPLLLQGGALALFAALQSLGLDASVRIQVGTCAVSVAVLALFYVYAPAAGATDARAHALANGWFNGQGVSGVLRCLPFGIWFWLGIEELPLAARECRDDPRRALPRALLAAWGVLFACTTLTVVVSASSPPGLDGVLRSQHPLLASFEGVLGPRGKGTARALSVLMLARQTFLRNAFF